MQVYINFAGPDDILFLVPDNDYESQALHKIGRVDEELVAVLKKTPAFLHAHLEIQPVENVPESEV